MSMYNMIMGVNPFARVLLATLGLRSSEVPRLRDVWWDGEHIVLYTRTGGGNREHYERLATEPADQNDPTNNDLRKVPGFVRDEDDDYDETYAKFYYELPEKYAWMKEKLVPLTDTSKQRWDRALDKLKKPLDPSDPESVRVQKSAQVLLAQLAEALGLAPK